MAMIQTVTWDVLFEQTVIWFSDMLVIIIIIIFSCWFLVDKSVSEIIEF